MEDYDRDLGAAILPWRQSESPWKPGSSDLSSLPGTQTGADQANSKHSQGKNQVDLLAMANQRTHIYHV